LVVQACAVSRYPARRQRRPSMSNHPAKFYSARRPLT
jgi:hypothetical protein